MVNEQRKGIVQNNKYIFYLLLLSTELSGRVVDSEMCGL